jgi:hypothetical protein
MDSEYIVDKNIFCKLCHTPLKSNREYWSKCVEKLDLGISYEPTSYEPIRYVYLDDYGDHRYRIVDKKKWLLSKLKYGI